MLWNSGVAAMFFRMRTIAKTQPQRMKKGMLIMKSMLNAKALAVWSCSPSLQVGHAIATSQNNRSVAQLLMEQTIWRIL